jgi:hypothetical protein
MFFCPVKRTKTSCRNNFYRNKRNVDATNLENINIRISQCLLNVKVILNSLKIDFVFCENFIINTKMAR